MTLENYLQQQQLSEASIKAYLFVINKYVVFVGERKASNATYTTIVDYVHYLLHQKKASVKSCKLAVNGIKHYYYYLQHIGKHGTHPCAYFDMKQRAYTAPHIDELFTPQELQQLLILADTYIAQTTNNLEKHLAIRNKVALSILVYQAVTLKELINLRLQHIHIAQGTVHINERELPLHATQILLLQDYLKSTRPYLLQRNTLNNTLNNEYVLLTNAGKPANADVIHLIIQGFRKGTISKHLTVTRIRQSVIAQLLKEGKDLRIVQCFAGHKQAHSTEKYSYNGINQLKGLIEQHHPLNRL